MAQNDEATRSVSNGHDFLWPHLKELPAFRALLRAVEARYYQDIEMPVPILDLGCGDGHFASVAFPGRALVGIDLGWQELREAAARDTYRWVIQGDATELPFPSAFFGTVISNSVLEHIPNIEAVLAEVSRVLEPGGQLIFCSPSEYFTANLSLYRLLAQVGWYSMAEAYGRWFNRISRHYHCDSPDQWAQRLRQVGLRPLRSWYYFSPGATTLFEWGHFYGLPSLFFRKLTKRWIIAPWTWSLKPVEWLLRPFYEEPPREGGACFFMIVLKE